MDGVQQLGLNPIGSMAFVPSRERLITIEYVSVTKSICPEATTVHLKDRLPANWTPAWFTLLRKELN